MNLPYSEQLDIGHFDRFFDNTSECYKFFWFKAILSKISEGKTEYTYEELVDEMIAEAWLWIFYFIVQLDYTINPCVLRKWNGRKNSTACGLALLCCTFQKNT